MSIATGPAVAEELRALFASCGAEGFAHAIDVGNGEEVGLNADAAVVAASVFKIPVLLELSRQAAAGELDLAERITVEAEGRTMGPTGLSVMLDEVELSLRDLATLMMSVSDNAATDLLMTRVGLDRIRGTLRSLGLANTVVTGDCADIFSSLPEDLGMSMEEIVESASPIPDEVMRKWRALDPEQTTRTTARDITRLLRLIATDEAGPPEACAEVRRIMGLQVWPHRLRAGFGDEVKTWAKTGTLPGIRNEAGVVEFPDGARYAVAIFTRSASLAQNQPPVDAAIAEAASLAVSALRR